MENKNFNKNILLVSVLLGILISLQFKAINAQNNGMTTSKQGELLQIQLKSLKEKESKLKNEIDSMKKSIDIYKYDENNELQKGIAKEIEKYEKLAGYTDVTGNGIEMIIESSNNISNNDVSQNISYNYDLILSIINKLNSAQANAISINSQRIVNNTYIKSDDKGININGISIKEPFVIKAIGDQDTLESALKIKYGIVWEIEKYYNAKVSVEKKDNIMIKRYTPTTEYKYSNLKG